MIIPFAALACPLDGLPLSRHQVTWRCGGGHAFDIARQGHAHLLPVQQKRSRDPGDSKEMVAARQRFLNAGHYEPIAQAVAGVTVDGLPAGATAACLDAGCGEGYDLRALAAANPERRLALLGLDISKWAVLAAAKQCRDATWVVGSNANLPVLAATLDRVLCMFGFPVHAEFARVLKPGGRLVMVDAGPDHLRELREIIYPMLKPRREPAGDAPAGFIIRDASALRHSVALEGAQPIADLLAMTPHLFRASAEGRARAATLTALSLTVDVRICVLERTAA